MSIDLSQFHQVFFEESLEGLEQMEASLLELNLDAVDSEDINTIFRAAHSIKGGAGTFGFSSIADFTHVAETLLDEVREGTRAIDKPTVDLLLKSVDCLRDMMAALQAGSEPDPCEAKELQAKFESLLNNEAAPVEPKSDEPAKPEDESTGWHIYFKPGAEILRTGNEPLRMFRELASIDENASLSVTAITDALPGFSNIHPEECYLAWNLEYRGLATKEQVDEVFEWVIDESELVITALGEIDVATADAEIPQEITPVVEQISQAAEVSPAIQELADSKAIETKDKAVEAKDPAKAKKATKAAETSSIRVGIDKVDSLINMVGELVITQSMLGQLGEEFDMTKVQRLQEGLAQLEQNTRELQESVMKIRMIPISFAFSRFPRLVRDLSQAMDKHIDLVMTGENTELDKTVMEKIGDPLVHLVRNSLDHGIETPEVRTAAGKSESGTITLNAFHQGGNIVIEVKDDGGGLNSEKIREKAVSKGLIKASDNLSQDQINDLIFEPGFSTADVVSDISGRGVGMDVVRRNIGELNGSIEVVSEEGKGSNFIIRLPLTLAILDGQLLRVGSDTYIFPLVSIVESLQIDMDMINNVGGNNDVLRLRDEYVPIIRLYETFNLEPDSKDLRDGLLVVVESDNEKIGIVVDDLLGQQQVVIKSLEQNYKRVEGISGATILGDGTVALIVDISGLRKMADLQPRITRNSNREKAA